MRLRSRETTFRNDAVVGVVGGTGGGEDPGESEGEEGDEGEAHAGRGKKGGN